MGPLFGLVPEIDTSLRAMEKATEPLRDAIKNASPPEDRDAKQETFNAAMSVVMWHCLKPSFSALTMFFLDMLIGPGRSIIALPILLIVVSAVRKQRPAASMCVLCVLCITPWISASFTRLLGAHLCIDTFLSPLIWYTYEDISDHTEIRWVMIGCALDAVYFGTLLLTLLFRPFFAVVLIIISWIGVVPASMFIFDPGWTMALAQAAPEMQVPGKPMETIPRYWLQLLMFRLNRIARTWGKKLGFLTRQNGSKTPQQRWWSIPYEYKSLENEAPGHARDIRLLKIMKGSPDEELACKLIVVSLDNTEEFEAISYVWGNPAKEKAIIVDGCDLSITKSAYDIIHRRRSPWQDRLIWIDQVCINQAPDDGDTEKQYQVEMMKDIYKAATRVLAFLHEDHPMVEIGVPTPRPNAYLVQSHFAELFYRHDILGHNRATFKAVYQRESKAAQWDALVAFFANAWFRRVWIVQEAVFAKDLIVFYGDVCLDWRYVARAVNVIYEQNLLQRFQSSDTYSHSKLREEYNMGLHNVDSMLEFRGEFNYGKAFTLEHVLEMCTYTGSTDKRDKVYALLGLTKDGSQDLIKSDYGDVVTPCMVYTKAMKTILSRRDDQPDEDTFHTLRIAGIGFERNIDDLPSWVPDWSQTNMTTILDTDYNAGALFPPHRHFPETIQPTLQLKGFCFDRIKTLTDPLILKPEWTTEDEEAYLKEWYKKAEDLATSKVQDPYPFTREPFLEAFVRTVMGNRSFYGRNSIPTTEECLRDYSAFRRFKQMKEDIQAHMERGDSTEGREADEFIREFEDAAERRSRFNVFSGMCLLRKRFCVSVSGRMAVVPQYSREGDIFCIIHGARTPYLLREQQGGVYKLVGCCYVHGSMYMDTPPGRTETFSLV